LEVGEIYYGHLSSMDPPKNKFFVLAGIELNQNIVLLAIVGSELEMAAIKSRDLRNMMVGMEVSVYAYLRHTSKLNCSKVVNKELTEVQGHVNSGQFTKKGTLRTIHKKKMIEFLLKSARVSPAYKDIIKGGTPTLIEFK
jgi:hypothetical protein